MRYKQNPTSSALLLSVQSPPIRLVFDGSSQRLSLVELLEPGEWRASYRGKLIRDASSSSSSSDTADRRGIYRASSIPFSLLLYMCVLVPAIALIAFLFREQVFSDRRSLPVNIRRSSMKTCCRIQESHSGSPPRIPLHRRSRSP
jgi:hypothetical protein